MTKEKSHITQEIPIDKIRANHNARADFNPERMKELAESIKADGLMHPVTVRTDGNGGYDLIAGERRLRACKAIGLKVIYARVVDADDEKAQRLQVIENLQRVNLNPIEEAMGFESLLKTPTAGVTQAAVEAIANDVDKTPAYVFRSLSLLKLPAKFVAAIRDGKTTPAHGHQILRAPEKQREALVEFALTMDPWHKRLPGLEDLKREVEKKVQKKLDDALFPKDSPFAGEPACTLCEFNTGNQGALFDGAVKGFCTGPACYTKKTNQFYKDFQAKAQEKFQGMRFVGAVAGRTGDNRVKGFPIVDPKDKKVKALMEKNPAGFAWGVVKPSTWGGSRKPETVIVLTDAKLIKQDGPEISNGNGHRSTEDYEKDRFIAKAITRALLKEAPEAKILNTAQFRLVAMDHLLSNGNKLAAILEHMGIEIGQHDWTEILEKQSPPKLFQAMYLATLLEWDVQSTIENLKKVGVKKEAIKKAVMVAEKEGAAAWEAKKAEKKPAPSVA